MTLTCTICGAAFAAHQPRRRRTCSLACRFAAQRHDASVRAEIKAMRAEGHIYAHIAAVTGVLLSTAAVIAREVGHVV